MNTAAEYRRKAEEALHKAMAAANPVERGRLLGLAAHWSALAKAPQEPRSFQSKGDTPEHDGGDPDGIA